MYKQKKIIYSSKVWGQENYLILEQQISILEWFLKDHVTLKTGIMAENVLTLSAIFFLFSLSPVSNLLYHIYSTLTCFCLVKF